MVRLGVLFFLGSLVFFLPIESHADAKQGLPPDVADQLIATFCDPKLGLDKALSQIDGFAVSGGVTLKGSFSFSCEVSVWRKRGTDNRTHRVANHCFPAVDSGWSEKKALPLGANMNVSILFGCKGEPENYNGYFASVGAAGARLNFGVGDGVFEDIAQFTQLAERAKNSGGSTFDAMVMAFTKAKQEIAKASDDLKKDPAAELALKAFRGDLPYRSGFRPADEHLRELVRNTTEGVRAIDEILPEIRGLRDRVRETQRMTGSDRKLAEGLVSSEAKLLQHKLSELRKRFEPGVASLTSTTALSDNVLKGSAKSVLDNPFLPDMSEEERLEAYDRIERSRMMLNPMFTGRPSHFKVDPVTNKRIGSVWQVPAKYLSFELKTIVTGENRGMDVSVRDYDRATKRYQDMVQSAIRAVEATQGFSLYTDRLRANTKLGMDARLDIPIGAIEGEPRLSGCNSISLPIQNLLMKSPLSVPAALLVASDYDAYKNSKGLTRNANYQRFQESLRNLRKTVPGSGRLTREVGGGLSHYYMTNRQDNVTTPQHLKALFDALDSCAARPARATTAGVDRGYARRGAPTPTGPSRASEPHL